MKIKVMYKNGRLEGPSNVERLKEDLADLFRPYSGDNPDFSDVEFQGPWFRCVCDNASVKVLESAYSKLQDHIISVLESNRNINYIEVE